MDGIGLLKELQTRSPGLRVVIITAHGTIPDAVSATQSGAFGFLTKPIDKDELMQTVERALKVSGSIDIGEDWAAGIITRNQGMKEVLNQAKMVAATDARVLITGESGHRQGIAGPRHSQRQPALQPSRLSASIARDGRESARVRALRSRKRRVHGRDALAPRACSRQLRAAACCSMKSATCRCAFK